MIVAINLAQANETSDHDVLVNSLMLVTDIVDRVSCASAFRMSSTD